MIGVATCTVSAAAAFGKACKGDAGSAVLPALGELALHKL